MVRTGGGRHKRRARLRCRESWIRPGWSAASTPSRDPSVVDYSPHDDHQRALTRLDGAPPAHPRSTILESAAQTTDSTVLDYLRIVRRRAWLVVVAALASTAMATVVSAQATRIYAARADILVTGADESVFGRDGLVVADPTQIETQVQVLRSRSVAREVAAGLGPRASQVASVGVSSLGRTRVIRVEVESADRTVARDAATSYATVYVEQRRTAAVNSSLAIADQVARKLQETKNLLNSLDARLGQLRSARVPNEAEIQNLETQRSSAAAQYSAFQQKLDQVQVDVPLRTGGVELLTEAALPTTPVRPAPIRTGVLAFMLGLIVGVGAVFVFDFLDDTVRSPTEVERLARGRALLATIPVIAEWKNQERPRLITVDDPNAIASEAYRSLRTSLQFIGLRQPLKTIMVSSPMASEGKTTTLSNLAVTLAQAGRQVICIDCDLRRPRLNEFFSVSNAVGFTSVLLGEQPLSSALQEVAVAAGGRLRILPSGPLPPNPAELLGTARVAELLRALASEADVVLIDAPPLLPITDAVVLSSRVDGVVLVATARVTSRRYLSRAVSLLDQADANTLGVVLNGVGSESGYGSGYRYRYRYKYEHRPDEEGA